MLRPAPSIALAAVLAFASAAPAFAAEAAAPQSPAAPASGTASASAPAAGSPAASPAAAPPPAASPSGAAVKVGPATLGSPVTLSPQEVDMLKLKLIQAKPNVSTVAITSFLAPGSAQAMMGHVDRAFLLWGGYLLGFTALKVALPANLSSFPGGPKTSDVAVGSLFLGIAALSALDAAMLASQEREAYDKALNRLTDKEPLPRHELVRP